MNVIPFKFNASTVRVIDKEGEPWFVAKDVADVLAYSLPSAMTRHLDDDEKGMSTMHTPGGNQELQTINESGLYSAILKSRRPEAKAFKRWVTHEVLPSIRKNGGYIAGQEKDEPSVVLAKAVLMAQSIIETKTAQLDVAKEEIKAMLPKAEAFEKIAASNETLCITNAAKDLQMKPRDLFSWLSMNKWIYRRPGAPGWTAYQDKIQRGFLVHKFTAIERQDGSEKIVDQVRLTTKGVAKLAQALI
ncbi:phage antirepressor [Zooshikella ganghwensis]|uniref:Phage repressor protein/antirepressor Ant n=1 Tax=Zooshikella ganghwensis TaxID=202772 RepID=A0A4P9VF37_9GAMM|nr:phage antirepressor KilAC domain-containing protein [Zooshikella ganghwensis]RDH41607.1 phage repressor protein/antirepressor Ant [Zooshikella ganghwensis]RDH41673.1 phage repressor protein/antirepressor Ant [Zooshikella ganghwensis]RDH41697.1 phage repressor protein/antirepressor Ant [Zooshikella ganghwensis]RDH41756.1 phage repressor protein/antirepressor Ant [Zooshikella ganghwensis]